MLTILFHEKENGNLPNVNLSQGMKNKTIFQIFGEKRACNCAQNLRTFQWRKWHIFSGSDFRLYIAWVIRWSSTHSVQGRMSETEDPWAAGIIHVQVMRHTLTDNAGLCILSLNFRWHFRKIATLFSFSLFRCKTPRLRKRSISSFLGFRSLCQKQEKLEYRLSFQCKCSHLRFVFFIFFGTDFLSIKWIRISWGPVWILGTRFTCNWFWRRTKQRFQTQETNVGENQVTFILCKQIETGFE